MQALTLEYKGGSPPSVLYEIGIRLDLPPKFEYFY